MNPPKKFVHWGPFAASPAFSQSTFRADMTYVLGLAACYLSLPYGARPPVPEQRESRRANKLAWSIYHLQLRRYEAEIEASLLRLRCEGSVDSGQSDTRSPEDPNRSNTEEGADNESALQPDAHNVDHYETLGGDSELQHPPSVDQTHGRPNITNSVNIEITITLGSSLTSGITTVSDRAPIFVQIPAVATPPIPTPTQGVSSSNPNPPEAPVWRELEKASGSPQSGDCAQQLRFVLERNKRSPHSIPLPLSPLSDSRSAIITPQNVNDHNESNDSPRHSTIPSPQRLGGNTQLDSDKGLNSSSPHGGLISPPHEAASIQLRPASVEPPTIVISNEHGDSSDLLQPQGNQEYQLLREVWATSIPASPLKRRHTAIPLLEHTQSIPRSLSGHKEIWEVLTEERCEDTAVPGSWEDGVGGGGDSVLNENTSSWGINRSWRVGQNLLGGIWM
ncbi:hypothetical protein FRB94_010553 [Tulasnella sp. JGI-2019a]|nr:hypothetical protein FRB94_010553 [Tulasnella sp. JGI-2019a]KAG9017894.1 hypothetical protein FRB93_004705 [Tulasnella sp. JGI-2019a]